MQSGSIHGHAILNYIIDHGGQVSLDGLRQWARATHGENARYHTCSIQDLPFDAILRFLTERNKITVLDDCASVNVQNICGHGEHPSKNREA